MKHLLLNQSVLDSLSVNCYTRGGQIDELREPQFMRQLRQKPCIDKTILKHRCGQFRVKLTNFFFFARNMRVSRSGHPWSINYTF